MGGKGREEEGVESRGGCGRMARKRDVAEGRARGGNGERNLPFPSQCALPLTLSSFPPPSPPPSSQVIKENRLQRFCQQCGRLHDLSAFDGARKSCRDQLNKHNARRRRRTQMEQLKVWGEGESDGGVVRGVSGGVREV